LLPLILSPAQSQCDGPADVGDETCLSASQPTFCPSPQPTREFLIQYNEEKCDRHDQKESLSNLKESLLNAGMASDFHGIVSRILPLSINSLPIYICLPDEAPVYELVASFQTPAQYASAMVASSIEERERLLLELLQVVKQLAQFLIRSTV